MSSVTQTRPPRQPRVARLMQVGGPPVLALTSGKDTVFYRITPIDHGFGQAAFRLEKANRGDGPGEEYDVLIDGARSSCECLGFLRHRHCKHLEGIESLIAAGKLAIPAAPAPASPKPAVDPAPAKCPYRCGCPLEDHGGTEADPWAFCPL